MSFQKIVELTLLTISLILCWFLCTIFFKQGFVDDTYISLRYVMNLVDGHGLTWNLGQPPIEGFSNLLWIVILFLFNESDAERLVQIARNVNIVFAMGTIVLAWFFCRSCLQNKLKIYALLTPFTLALSPYFLRHGVSGMETMQVSFVFLLCGIVWHKILTTRSDKLPQSAFLLFFTNLLACLSRPDALIFIFFGNLSLAYYIFKQKKFTGKQSLILILAAALPASMLIVWKQWYFGTLVSPPYLIKSSILLIFQESKFFFFWLGHLLTFFSASSVYLFVIFLSLSRCSDECSSEDNFHLMPFAHATTAFFLFFLTILPVMSFHFRYFFPVHIALICMANIFFPDNLNNDDSKTESWQKKLFAGAVILALVTSNIGEMARIKKESIEGYQAYLDYGRLGAEIQTIPGSSIACTEAGQLAFYSKARFLDLVGLNDYEMARYSAKLNSEKNLVDYIANKFKLPDIYVETNSFTMPEIIGKNYERISSKWPNLSIKLLKTSPRFENLKFALTKPKN